MALLNALFNRASQERKKVSSQYDWCELFKYVVESQYWQVNYGVGSLKLTMEESVVWNSYFELV